MQVHHRLELHISTPNDPEGSALMTSLALMVTVNEHKTLPVIQTFLLLKVLVFGICAASVPSIRCFEESNTLRGFCDAFKHIGSCRFCKLAKSHTLVQDRTQGMHVCRN